MGLADTLVGIYYVYARRCSLRVQNTRSISLFGFMKVLLGSMPD